MKKRKITTLLVLLIFPFLFTCAQAGERQVFTYYANGIAQFVEDGYVGLLNAEGEVILPAKYESISPRYWEGLAVARSESDTLYIDEGGNILIELPQVWGNAFKNGYAWVYGTINHITGRYLIDRTGKAVYVSADTINRTSVSEGMAFCVRRTEEEPIGCYINTNGNVAFDLPRNSPYEYEDYGVGDRLYNRNFNNGLALFEDADGVHLIDKQGTIVRTLPMLSDFMDFSFGSLSVARDPETRLYGFINTKGEYIVPPVGRTAYPMIEDRGFMEIEPGLWRCYDETGQLIFEMECDSVSPFYQGYAVTRRITRTTEFVEYDENHQPQLSVWAAWGGADPIESDLPLAPGYNITTTSVTSDVIDRDGNVIINDSVAIVWREVVERKGYNNYMPMSDGLIAIEEDGKYGFMDIHEEIVIRPQFEEMVFFSVEEYDNMNTHFVGGYARVKKDGKWWVINTKGEVVSPGSLQTSFSGSRDE